MSDVKLAMDNILDTFTGADGGIKFVKLRSALDAFEIKAGTGDKASEKILEVVTNFSRLIDVIARTGNDNN